MAPSSSWDGAPARRRHSSWVWHVSETSVSSMSLACLGHPRGLVARAVGVLDLLRHGLRDALIVVGHAALPDVCGGDGVKDPLTAGLGVLGARAGLAVSHDVLTLHTAVRMAVLGQVGGVDPEAAKRGWCGRVDRR